MEQPMAGLFQVLRGQSEGAFKKAETLGGTDGNPLIIPCDKENWTENICTRPFAIDWDGDGHLDLVVGNFPGTFYLFKGQGQGKFLPEPEQLKSGDEPLRIQGHHSDPFVIDWDTDGDLDLLSGSSEGGVQWSENRAGPNKPPKLEAFQSLIKPGSHPASGQVFRDDDLVGPTSNTRVWVDDVNGDGKLDIFVGDSTTLVSPANGASEQGFKTKYKEWNEAVAKVLQELRSPSDDKADNKARNEAQQRFQKLYSDRSAFMNEDRTGFVWLYLQK
jgi:hypothetical protein